MQRPQEVYPVPPWWEDWALWSSLVDTQRHINKVWIHTRALNRLQINVWKALTQHQRSEIKNRYMFRLANINSVLFLTGSVWMKWNDDTKKRGIIAVNNMMAWNQQDMYDTHFSLLFDCEIIDLNKTTSNISLKCMNSYSLSQTDMSYKLKKHF